MSAEITLYKNIVTVPGVPSQAPINRIAGYTATFTAPAYQTIMRIHAVTAAVTVTINGVANTYEAGVIEFEGLPANADVTVA